MAENERLTKEEFKSTFEPKLDRIAELLITHQDIPEDVDQSELLATINLCKTEMEQTLEDRVAEITDLQAKLATKEKQVRKLQETNQQLFLKLGSTQQPPEPQQQKPRKSFREIGAMIDNLPG